MTSQPSAHNTQHMLYLEDDDALAFMTSKALTRRGFMVHHVSTINGLNAQYLQAEAQTPFSHALLDMKLDDGNSLTLLETLIQRYPGINVVLLTGYASIATAVQAIKLGAHNYLPKPASIEEIMTAFGEPCLPLPENDEPQDQAMSLKRIEWEKIQQALLDNNGNITLTAKQLNMHRRTLQRKLQKRPVAI